MCDSDCLMLIFCPAFLSACLIMRSARECGCHGNPEEPLAGALMLLLILVLFLLLLQFSHQNVSVRRMKTMSHVMKIWERDVEAALRQKGSFCEQQQGFMTRAPRTPSLPDGEEQRIRKKSLCLYGFRKNNAMLRKKLWRCMKTWSNREL